MCNSQGWIRDQLGFGWTFKGTDFHQAILDSNSDDSHKLVSLEVEGTGHNT